MLDLFNYTNTEEVKKASNSIADALKKEHNIVIKKSKMLNLISKINGFSNWHSFKNFLDEQPDIVNLSEEEIENLFNNSSSFEPVDIPLDEFNEFDDFDKLIEKSEIKDEKKENFIKDNKKLYYPSMSQENSDFNHRELVNHLKGLMLNLNENETFENKNLINPFN